MHKHATDIAQNIYEVYVRILKKSFFDDVANLSQVPTIWIMGQIRRIVPR